MSIRLLSYQQSSEKAQKTSCCFVFQYEPLVCMILCKTIQEKKLSSCECVWLKVSNVLDEEEHQTGLQILQIVFFIHFVQIHTESLF